MLDDFSRYIPAWKLCTTMTAIDVSDTLAMALRNSRLDRVRVQHRPRLLSDNRASYVSAQLGSWLVEYGVTHTRGKPLSPDDPRQDRTLPPFDEEPNPAQVEREER